MMNRFTRPDPFLLHILKMYLAYIKDVLGNKIQQKTLVNLLDFSINAIANDPKFSEGRVKHYKCIKNKLMDFLKSEKRLNDIRLADLNYKFIAEFDAFLSREYRNCLR